MPIITVTASVSYAYDTDKLDGIVNTEEDAIEDVRSMLASGEALAPDEYTITVSTRDPDCPRCEGSGEVTRPGSASRDSNGVWDRETMPCPECQPQ